MGTAPVFFQLKGGINPVPPYYDESGRGVYNGRSGPAVWSRLVSIHLYIPSVIVPSIWTVFVIGTAMVRHHQHPEELLSTNTFVAVCLTIIWTNYLAGWATS